MRDLGLLSADPVRGVAPTPIDALCGQLQAKLSYKHGERDMVLLQHEFEIETASGSRERHTSSLVSYGDGFGMGDSAMAKTVGFPVAMATQLILDKQIDRTGVVKPTTEDFYTPILAELEARGLPVIES
ncbi:saccharopine dehydrogenase [Sphaeroforma arctica JP610]|uniref:Saccharopine dehydrogenase n=1 Tax=Sphaeroforma arctica JP610 TaxID=667725 RepID=A0A0L0FVA6_9EUKA|nr:saccharopine dehydrogenase [Sphaeroforma arctica JP610]KNC80785.1 saccharopine dehydrogenase [Sphaeroforma arctica JP610]|eukprot:XP_014154687.1 saccharopine dehydrogenase [Sphaeroforma arctica JP610]